MDTILKILHELKPGFDFEGKNDLVDSGVFDSFDVIELVSELNDKLDIDIPVEEIIPENFNSLAAIEALVNDALEE